jgi:hypothetical protein
MSKGGFRNVGSGLMQPLIGTAGAVQNLAIGARNIIDPHQLQDSKEKYKSNNPKKK